MTDWRIRVIITEQMFFTGKKGLFLLILVTFYVSIINLIVK